MASAGVLRRSHLLDQAAQSRLAHRGRVAHIRHHPLDTPQRSGLWLDVYGRAGPGDVAVAATAEYNTARRTVRADRRDVVECGTDRRYRQYRSGLRHGT